MVSIPRKRMLIIGLVVALAGAFVLQTQAAQAPGGPRIVDAVQVNIPGGPAVIVVNNQQPAPERSQAVKVLLVAKEVAHAGFEIGHATFEMAWATGKFCYKAAVLAYVIAKRTIQATRWASQNWYTWFTHEEPRPAPLQPAIVQNNVVPQDNPQNPPAINPTWEE
jgi:hypothetical protein